MATQRIIVWSYQSNYNPWNMTNDEGKVWQRYSEIENKMIEAAYQNGYRQQIHTFNYGIDFRFMLQVWTSRKRSDSGKHPVRPVKREEIEVLTHQFRMERFTCTKAREVHSFVPAGEGYASQFVDKWRERHPDLCTNGNYKRVCELAIEGIIAEGELAGREVEAQYLGNELWKVQGGKTDEIVKRAVHLYTMQSFLCPLLNSTLRKEDMSKVDTLGPFCCLLFYHIYEVGDSEVEQTVYRGCGLLPQETIDQYIKATGSCIRFPGFTSTSKNRAVADAFGGYNTLFIIHIPRGTMFSRDISAISIIPDEEEVLLYAGHMFTVKEVKCPDPMTPEKQYLVYLEGR